MRYLGSARRFPQLASAGVGALLWAGAALAQSVDYGALEQMFGEPVTASATGKPQRVSDVPVDMDIITAEDIRRSGYDNLPDILSLVPGVDVRRYGFAAADVGIRGYDRPSNPRLLVLVNGQQAYVDDYGRTQWYALPVELGEIRQIEVIKGPNSALYGFNAASGVINIITWNPLRDKVNTITANAGTQGYAGLSAVGTGQIGDWGGVRLSAGGFRANDFALTGLSTIYAASDTIARRGSLAADARAHVTPDIEVGLNASMVNLRAFEETGVPSLSDDFYRTNAVRATMSADTGLGLLALNLFRNESQFSNLNVSTANNEIKDVLYVAQASDTVKLGVDHTFRLGLEYRNSAVSSSTNTVSQLGYQVPAASAMWDWQIMPRLSLTNAVRVDHLILSSPDSLPPGIGLTPKDYAGRSLTVPSFNSGLVWHASDADTLRLTAARGLQLPSLFDFGAQVLAGRLPVGGLEVPEYFVGSPNLRASVISNVELAYERVVSSLHSTLRAAVFAQRTDDVITDPIGINPVFNGQSFVNIAANTGHSAALGGELGIRGKVPLGVDSILRWDASYSYISISDGLSASTVSAIAMQDFEHGAPRHVVRLGGGYSWGRLEFDVHGRWQSSYLDYRLDFGSNNALPLEISNYLQVDSRLGYRLTENLRLGLTAEQFNTSRLLQSAGPPIERRVIGSVTAEF